MTEHVPSSLDHPYFKQLIERPTAITADVTLFLHEIAHYSDGGGNQRPWEKPGQSVPMLYDAWGCLREEISLAFKKRDKALIESSMRKGVGLFLHVLFWSNGQPVSLACLPDICGLFVKPVNCGDRIQFLMDRPDLFHSFIQLGELMNEQYRSFMVKLAKEKHNQ
ncbi:YpoC family protein [Bacillus sp. FJAT-27245]|uniref:YpoC family protein n=1 Tax=Bacillus sp. FJAT-27245 TaxID=1684144 RepID=UPI0006A7E942|nr:hypothetical protein [Bacillus sp. FJAT-27245]